MTLKNTIKVQKRNKKNRVVLGVITGSQINCGRAYEHVEALLNCSGEAMLLNACCSHKQRGSSGGASCCSCHVNQLGEQGRE